MKPAKSLEKLGFDVDVAETDVVVVGGGGAASRAAVSAALAGARVMVVAKAPIGEGGSTVHGASEIMSMGASGYGSREDSAEIHYRDTMEAAKGFIDPALVRVLAEDSPARIADLIHWGVPFDRKHDETYKLIQSDFGSYPRALGVSGKTGKAFVSALVEQSVKLGVDTRYPLAFIDLLRNASGEVNGVLALDLVSYGLVAVTARAVILGTGGAHGLFSQQVSTAEMTGDGQAICFRHGAELVNMEFHQFGPALVHPYVQLFSKSLFILHPKMTNRLGNEFLENYLPPGVTEAEAMDEKVFPFTISNPSMWIDIAMAAEIAQGRGTERGAVLYSLAHVDPARLEATIPNTMRWMRANGVDAQRDQMEVGIGFQCLNGGVRMIDATAATSIPGLYVIGELAGGVRGPDRPGGNSLAEGQVFGHRAGTGAAHFALDRGEIGEIDVERAGERLASALRKNSGFDTQRAASELRQTMQNDCLVEKNEQGMNRALAVARETRARVAEGGNAVIATVKDALTVDNMATTAEFIVAACIERRESRASHYREDYPKQDDASQMHAVALRRDGDRIAFAPIHYPHSETAHSTVKA